MARRAVVLGTTRREVAFDGSEVGNFEQNHEFSAISMIGVSTHFI